MTGILTECFVTICVTASGRKNSAFKFAALFLAKCSNPVFKISKNGGVILGDCLCQQVGVGAQSVRSDGQAAKVEVVDAEDEAERLLVHWWPFRYSHL